MNLNKFKYVTPVFISLNFIVQVSIRKRKKKMIKKNKFFFKEKQILFKKSQLCQLFLKYCEYSEKKREIVAFGYFNAHSQVHKELFNYQTKIKIGSSLVLHQYLESHLSAQSHKRSSSQQLAYRAADPPHRPTQGFY